MQIELVLGDITKIKADAIVNAANSSLLGGGGVDGAIHRAAGKELLEECRKLNGCHAGEAKLTKGYNLDAKYVLHTVGPVWHGGDNDEPEILRNCYINCLDLAVQHGIKSIAFPCISTGVYRFPIDKAARIAVETVKGYRPGGDIEKVYFVCFDKQNYDEYTKVLGLIRTED